MKHALALLLQRCFPALFARLQLRVSTAKNFRIDRQRFSSQSGVAREVERIKLQARITMDYHRLEKGLSLRAPRPDFGAQVTRELIANLAVYGREFGADVLTATTCKVLDEYLEFRRKQGTEDPAIVAAVNGVRNVLKQPDLACGGGTIEIDADDILRRSRIGEDFFTSRHSIRDFSDRPVEVELLQAAVRMAQRTPSVCNRQAWRVHVARGAALKERWLSLQNGNAGFRSQIACALVVVCDLRHFVSVGERNQAWIDGGMFAMSLAHALHSLGLGTCFLNWSVTADADRKLRPLLKVTQHDVIITMLAVGHLPDRLRVAHSQRKHLDEVLILED